LLVKIGQIVGTWGLKGQVKVEPLTDFPSRFDAGTRVKVGDDWHTIDTSTWHKGRPLIKLRDIDGPDAAASLQWKFLEAEDIPPDLEEDEYRTADLVGLRVETASGELLGNVEDVLPFPAHDVLLVDGLMIPAVKEFVLDVDLEGGMILVQLIEGMREGGL
jgi:16S rRNA processing protein RimM